MILVSKKDFEQMAGKVMPLRRNMSTFDGENYQCACGDVHEFNSSIALVIAEGLNGKFIITCPIDSSFVSLIKTKMKWGMIYQGLEYIAGYQDDS